MFRRFYTHPLAVGSAIAITFMLLLGVTHIAGTEGAYHMLARISDDVAQQVVIVGHRVVQSVEVIGKKLRN